MKNRLIILLVILTISSYSPAQELDYQKIDTSAISNWIEKNHSSYASVFNFGDSESESKLVIIYAEKTVVAQVSWFEWNETSNEFYTLYKTLTNIIIINGKFESDQYNGKFVFYAVGEAKRKGLRIDNPWTAGIKKGAWELGLQSEYLFNCSGNYPEATTTFLSKIDLEKMSQNELKYMRNEIFARYGYIFRLGGEMDLLFKATDWYRPQHTNVDAFLTEIEKKNIELIQTLEN